MTNARVATRQNREAVSRLCFSLCFKHDHLQMTCPHELDRL